MAKGSVYETVNILIVLSEMDLVSSDQLERLINKGDEICRMLTGLIRK